MIFHHNDHASEQALEKKLLIETHFSVSERRLGDAKCFVGTSAHVSSAHPAEQHIAGHRKSSDVTSKVDVFQEPIHS